jgi:hypothetical protein
MKHLALGFTAGVVGGWAVAEVVGRVFARRYAKQWHFQAKAGKTTDSQVPVLE